MAETFSCNINWGENLDSRSYVKCFSDRRCGNFNEITGYILLERESPGAACTENVALAGHCHKKPKGG